MSKYAMVCINGETVNAVVVCEGGEVLRDALAEWANDPDTSMIVRAPLEVARRTLFESKTFFFEELSKAQV